MAKPSRTGDASPPDQPLCPSAQPDMNGATVFGVAGGTAGRRRVGYLTEPQPVTAEILALAGPVKPTEVFRISAACSGQACKHFDGRDCHLAKRIVQSFDPVVSGLPPCRIRPTCRWWLQEGRAACLRCPQVVTDTYDATELQKAVADDGPRMPIMPAAETVGRTD